MMYCKCDNCGKEKEAVSNHAGDWFKPQGWYERTILEENGCARRTIQVCSLPCAEEIENKRTEGKKAHIPQTDQ